MAVKKKNKKGQKKTKKSLANKKKSQASTKAKSKKVSKTASKKTKPKSQKPSKTAKKVQKAKKVKASVSKKNKPIPKKKSTKAVLKKSKPKKLTAVSKTSAKKTTAKKNIKTSSAKKNATKKTAKNTTANKKLASKSLNTKNTKKNTKISEKLSKNNKVKTTTEKITKADAARSTSNTQNISSPVKKSEEITIEKVLDATKEEEFFPKSVQTSGKPAFSDTLSDDLSSVYSRTSEEMPEPPGKFTLEFNCKASPELLYKFLTDPVELTEWFCDEVNIRNGIYTFVWNGVPQQARLVKQERNISVRFQWVDKNDGSYFEYNIHKNPLTGDVVLYVTDFSAPEELESNKLWWTSQINKLKTILGLQY